MRPRSPGIFSAIDPKLRESAADRPQGQYGRDVLRWPAVPLANCHLRTPDASTSTPSALSSTKSKVNLFGIFGPRNDLALGRDGLVESFDVALNGSDLTENVEVLRIGAEELVELFKRAIRYREVLRRVKVGND